MPTTASDSMISRHASSSSFSVNGSPTCTVGRFSLEVSSNSAEAMVAPWLAARRVQLAETQRVEAGDGARANGEDVAQNAAHARRRALVRLDERRMVVRLHLERRHPAVADVDDAGVLARPLHHARP